MAEIPRGIGTFGDAPRKTVPARQAGQGDGSTTAQGCEDRSCPGCRDTFVPPSPLRGGVKGGVKGRGQRFADASAKPLPPAPSPKRGGGASGCKSPTVGEARSQHL